MRTPPLSGAGVVASLISLSIKAICILFLGIGWAVAATWDALITRPGNRRHAARRAATAEAHRRAAWDAYYAQQAWERQQAEQAAWWAHCGPGWQPDEVVVAPMAADWSPHPVCNDVNPGMCFFCEHPKEHHEDDYACALPECGCEAEQYPGARWRAGDRMQFRDRVVIDGTVTYEKVMA